MPDEHSIGDAATLGGGKKTDPGFSLDQGCVLGQYTIVRPLGRGGMGEVYEAEHSTLQTHYALKLLPATLDWQGVSLGRFRLEAKVMAQLNHPHILKVDDFGETGGRYWLRMELAGGVEEVSGVGFQGAGKKVVSLQDLADARGGKIPQNEWLAILKQVLAGLDYAHQRGAIHRDLKPSNILLFPSLQHSNTPLIKITDFGLVRLVGEDWLRSQAQLTVQRSMSLGDQPTMGKAESEGTSTRSLLGTYEYMSPEQKRGEEADARSDLYALGVMTYRLLTGRNIGPKPPSRIDRELSPKWDEVVEKALEEDVEERLANAKAFLDLLEAITGVPVPAPTPQAPPTERPVLVKAEEAPAQVLSDPKPGDLCILALGGGVQLDLVWIPPGKFTMGSPESEDGRVEDEGPQHEVTISKGFWMGKNPVVQSQYEKITGANPSNFKQGGFLGFGGRTYPHNPVENVSWNDALKFCGKIQSLLPKELGKLTVNLPTEAQWEYACRAGTTGLNAGDLNAIAWYEKNSLDTTQPVGRKRPNAWGLHDMHGNVWEWCKDGKRNYTVTAQTDPQGPSESSKVLRGGSWHDYTWNCRFATRGIGDPAHCNDNIGFRVVVR